MDWCKGKITGKPHISWENLWFPADVSIETWDEMAANSARYGRMMGDDGEDGNDFWDSMIF